ncbi:MAG: hypothetical protein R2687_07135 [Candidatus Nanopelagicales bacterium]
MGWRRGRSNERYRDAFVRYDGDNKDDFTAYELPIADAVAGELKAVPRAVMSAAGVVDGAHGGLDFPDHEMGRSQQVLREDGRPTAVAARLSDRLKRAEVM